MSLLNMHLVISLVYKYYWNITEAWNLMEALHWSLVSNRWQAIAWANVDTAHRCIYVQY